MFQYRGTITRVIDADTLDVQIDLGFSTFRADRFRLSGVNAPEINTPEGQTAKAFVEQWVLAANSNVIISTVRDKRDKWRRYLATVSDCKGQSLNDQLLSNGFAKPYAD